ncbi:DUF58 domain-containing protein [Parashewanella curva]|uniref:DUF58 domain-containing protein n=1 Tax=Parashewanella curva TaxID=2338552 RepID=A0A3L8PWY1_9GAMM|nr:DUF58 domain-containing protein [Parashewanella curva]RLV59886.1 DUF58 domain-containing protein [Parashewanella curva]
MASPTLTFNELFDADFLSALQHFSLRVEKVQKGGRLAEQKTAARGQGLEFADFKPYVAGDDLRAIDWNIYRRLGRVFVRIFEEQQDMPVYFLIDVSASMFLENKPRINAALQTSLALSSISLSQHDSVGLFPFADEMQVKVKFSSGKRNVMRIAKHLSELEAQNQTNLTTSIHHLANLNLRKGLVVVISDFFDDSGIEKVVDSLKLLRHKLLLVQLTKASDADPSLNDELYGDIKLQDCETDGSAEITITPALLAKYKEIYQSFNQRLLDFTNQYGAGFVQIDTDEDVLEQLSSLFESGGLVL